MDANLDEHWTFLDGRPTNYPSKTQDSGGNLNNLEREAANALLNFYRELVFVKYNEGHAEGLIFQKFQLRKFEQYVDDKMPKKNKETLKDLKAPEEFKTNKEVIDLIARYRFMDYKRALNHNNFSWDFFKEPAIGGNPFIVNHSTKEAYRTFRAIPHDLRLNEKGMYAFSDEIELEMVKQLGDTKEPCYQENIKLRIDMEETLEKLKKLEDEFKSERYKNVKLQLELNTKSRDLETASNNLNKYQKAYEKQAAEPQKKSGQLQGGAAQGGSQPSNSNATTNTFGGRANSNTEAPPRGGAGNQYPAMRSNGATHQKATRPPNADYLKRFCNYCKAYGHETRTCIEFRKRPRGCWNCGLPDHRQWECKNEKVDGAAWLPGTKPEDRVRKFGGASRNDRPGRKGIFRKSEEKEDLDKFPDRIKPEENSDSVRLVLNGVAELEGIQSLDRRAVDTIIRVVTTAASWNEDDLKGAISKAKLDLGRELLREGTDREVMGRTIVIKNLKQEDKDLLCNEQNWSTAKELAAQYVKTNTNGQVDLTGYIKDLKWKEISNSVAGVVTKKFHLLIELFSREVQLRAIQEIEACANRDPNCIAASFEQGLTEKQIANDQWVARRVEEHNRHLEPGSPDEFIEEGEKGNKYCRRKVRFNKESRDGENKEEAPNEDVEILKVVDPNKNTSTTETSNLRKRKEPENPEITPTRLQSDKTSKSSLDQAALTTEKHNGKDTEDSDVHKGDEIHNDDN